MVTRDRAENRDGPKVRGEGREQRSLVRPGDRVPETLGEGRGWRRRVGKGRGVRAGDPRNQELGRKRRR